MEKQMERQREAEPIAMSRLHEEIQKKQRAEEERLGSLPRVLNYADIPWTQSANACCKRYTGDTPSALQQRLLQLPLFSFSLLEQVLLPGGKNGGHRHFNEAIFYIVEGQGFEIHDGIRYAWEAGDIMCVPTYCVHQHFNHSTDKPARMFFSVPFVFELLGISKVEQVGLHPDYEIPAGAAITRDDQGQIVGYRAAGGLELKLGTDLLYQQKMEDRRAIGQIVGEPKNKYDLFLNTLGQQTRWRQSVPHVIKGKEIPFQDTRMGKIKYLLSPYDPSPLLLYDCFIQEIPPGGRSGKHRHLSEEVHKILSGRGYDMQDGKRYDWSAEDIVAIPVNTVHQHFNADPHRPTTFVAFQSRLYHYLGHGGFEHLEDAPKSGQ